MAFAFYGPFALVIGGTQRVIANVGFLGLPLLLTVFHPATPRGGISWGFGNDGLLTNVCITTVGNLIGGTLFVALPFWIMRDCNGATSNRHQRGGWLGRLPECRG